MTRLIAASLALALVASLCIGCGSKEKGVKQTKDDRSQEVKDLNTMSKKVELWLPRFAADYEDTRKQQTACEAIAREAGNPQLTPDMKAQLIDAMTKLTMQSMDEKVIDAANKAIGALKAGAPAEKAAG